MERITPALIQTVARHDRGTDGSDRASLVYRRDSQNDRSQNRENECERWNERQHYPECKFPVVAPLIGNGWREMGSQEREPEDGQNV